MPNETLQQEKFKTQRLFEQPGVLDLDELNNACNDIEYMLATPIYEAKRDALKELADTNPNKYKKIYEEWFDEVGRPKKRDDEGRIKFPVFYNKADIAPIYQKHLKERLNWSALLEQFEQTKKDYEALELDEEAQEQAGIALEVVYIAKRMKMRQELEGLADVKSQKKYEQMRKMGLEDAMWQHKAIRMITSYRDNPELKEQMAILWQSVYGSMESLLSNEGRVESGKLKSGVFGAVGAASVFKEIGDVYLPSAEADVDDKVDMTVFIGGSENEAVEALFLQLKSGATRDLQATDAREKLEECEWEKRKLGDMDEADTNKYKAICKNIRDLKKLIHAAAEYEKKSGLPTRGLWVSVPSISKSGLIRNIEETTLDIDPHTGYPSDELIDKWVQNVNNIKSR